MSLSYSHVLVGELTGRHARHAGEQQKYAHAIIHRGQRCKQNKNKEEEIKKESSFTNPRRRASCLAALVHQTCARTHKHTRDKSLHTARPPLAQLMLVDPPPPRFLFLVLHCKKYGTVGADTCCINTHAENVFHIRKQKRCPHPPRQKYK